MLAQTGALQKEGGAGVECGGVRGKGLLLRCCVFNAPCTTTDWEAVHLSPPIINNRMMSTFPLCSLGLWWGSSKEFLGLSPCPAYGAPVQLGFSPCPALPSPGPSTAPEHGFASPASPGRCPAPARLPSNPAGPAPVHFHTCPAPQAGSAAPAWPAESPGGQQRARLSERRLGSAADRISPWTPTPSGPLTRAQPEPKGPCPQGGGRRGSGAAAAGMRGAARRASQMRLCHLLAPRPHCTSQGVAGRQPGGQARGAPWGHERGSAPARRDAECPPRSSAPGRNAG